MTLNLLFAQVHHVPAWPAATESHNSFSEKDKFSCIKLFQMIHIKQNFTSLSSSLILLPFCLHLIFSCSISAVSSLFFLDSSTILVAATAPAKPEVPKQMSWWSRKKLSHVCNISMQKKKIKTVYIIPAKASLSSSLFLFRCLISKSFSLRSLKSRPFSSFSSLNWSRRALFWMCNSLWKTKWTRMNVTWQNGYLQPCENDSFRGILCSPVKNLVHL